MLYAGGALQEETVSQSAEAKWIREDFLEEVTQMLRPKRCVCMSAFGEQD